jgi:hypothetical protein
MFTKYKYNTFLCKWQNESIGDELWINNIAHRILDHRSKWLEHVEKVEENSVPKTSFIYHL